MQPKPGQSQALLLSCLALKSALCIDSAAQTFTNANWTPVGSGVSSVVEALTVSENKLYAGGFFTKAGGTSASLVAKWDGTSWSALGSGVTGSGVYALAASDSNLYAGGSFTMAGGTPAANVANGTGAIGQLWVRA